MDFKEIELLGIILIALMMLFNTITLKKLTKKHNMLCDLVNGNVNISNHNNQIYRDFFAVIAKTLKHKEQE